MRFRLLGTISNVPGFSQNVCIYSFYVHILRRSCHGYVYIYLQQRYSIFNIAEFIKLFLGENGYVKSNVKTFQGTTVVDFLLHDSPNGVATLKGFLRSLLEAGV